MNDAHNITEIPLSVADFVATTSRVYDGNAGAG